MDLSALSDVDLSVFIKTIHEARFSALENDPLIWAAPFVVQLHVDLIAEHERRLAEQGSSEVARLRSWLVWRGREEHALVLRRRLREDPALRRLVRSNPAVMRDLLRPFVVDDDLLVEFADAAEPGRLSWRAALAPAPRQGSPGRWSGIQRRRRW
ncbi:hypothetical protein [Kribbella jejuensis]|uniref:hypothetical protein n=1 Tax=Kribbella jejuensis TaxID=236068 RepID=UPI001152BFD3|nr:hypothetical protein [Kribbella jejuensis]